MILCAIDRLVGLLRSWAPVPPRYETVRAETPDLEAWFLSLT